MSTERRSRRSAAQDDLRGVQLIRFTVLVLEAVRRSESLASSDR